MGKLFVYILYTCVYAYMFYSGGSCDGTHFLKTIPCVGFLRKSSLKNDQMLWMSSKKPTKASKKIASPVCNLLTNQREFEFWKSSLCALMLQGSLITTHFKHVFETMQTYGDFC